MFCPAYQSMGQSNLHTIFLKPVHLIFADVKIRRIQNLFGPALVYLLQDWVQFKSYPITQKNRCPFVPALFSGKNENGFCRLTVNVSKGDLSIAWTTGERILI